MFKLHNVMTSEIKRVKTMDVKTMGIPRPRGPTEPGPFCGSGLAGSA